MCCLPAGVANEKGRFRSSYSSAAAAAAPPAAAAAAAIAGGLAVAAAIRAGVPLNQQRVHVHASRCLLLLLPAPSSSQKMQTQVRCCCCYWIYCCWSLSMLRFPGCTAILPGGRVVTGKQKKTGKNSGQTIETRTSMRVLQGDASPPAGRIAGPAATTAVNANLRAPVKKKVGDSGIRRPS